MIDELVLPSNFEKCLMWCAQCQRPRRAVAYGDSRYLDGTSYRWLVHFVCGHSISTILGPGERGERRVGGSSRRRYR